jgi:hypothetical protein
MFKWNALLIAGALCLMAPHAAAQPAPEQAASQIVLPANALWLPTRINVRAGATLRISAQGIWSATTPVQSVTAVLRDTEATANGYDNMPAGRGAPMPNVNRAALIGRIGENGAPFLIGAAYRGRADADGMVFVTMNEPANEMANNQGRLAISITVLPPPQEQPQRPQVQQRPQLQPQQPAEPAPAPADPPQRDPTGRVPGAAPAPADPPEAPAPETPAPNDPPAPAADPQAPAASATPAPSAPAPQTGPIDPGPERDIDEPAMSDTVRYALIGAGVLAALLIISLMIRPRGARGGERSGEGAGAKVGARIVNDGIAGQSLTIRTGRAS